MPSYPTQELSHSACRSRPFPDDVIAATFQGMTILRPARGRTHRRVFYLNSYGMANAWRLIAESRYPTQHLWGCVELARRGYEVAIPEEARSDTRFYNYRRQDGRHLRFIASWLGREGIVYSAHTVVFWSPLLASIGLLRNPVVTLFYAGDETIHFARGYRGVLAMTPAAAERAASLAPRAKHAHISWGVDLDFFSPLPYTPRWFLSCGKSRRDYETLRQAAPHCPCEFHVTNKDLHSEAQWSDNVKLFTVVGKGEFEPVPYTSLINEEYAGTSASLVLLQPDPRQRFATGFTQLLEALALAKPVIVTRTGAIPAELDVEKEGCGLFVPAGDTRALASAISAISSDPKHAAEMGRAGRALCERRYNMRRFADELHAFFESL